MQPQQPYEPSQPQQPVNPLPPQPAGPPVTPVPPQTAVAAQLGGEPLTPNYDFILNPQKPARSSLFNFKFGGSSMAIRILVVLGGVVLLFVVLSVVKGALGGSNNAVPDLVSLVQDQQELISVVSSGTQNASAQNLKNFAITAQLSLQSERSQLLTYLQQADHRKVNAKEADLKVSKAVAVQLAASLASSSYDSTFTSTVETELKGYQHDLQQTYVVEKGPHGRTLLSNFYNDTNLLLKQLGD